MHAFPTSTKMQSAQSSTPRSLGRYRTTRYAFRCNRTGENRPVFWDEMGAIRPIPSVTCKRPNRLGSAAAPYVLVRSPTHQAKVEIFVEDNAWVNSRANRGQGEKKGLPSINIGVKGDGPRIALLDSEHIRIMLGMFGPVPALALWDWDGETSKLVWQTPVSPEDEAATEVLKAEAEATSGKNAEETRREMEERLDQSRRLDRRR